VQGVEDPDLSQSEAVSLLDELVVGDAGPFLLGAWELEGQAGRAGVSSQARKGCRVSRSHLDDSGVVTLSHTGGLRSSQDTTNVMNTR
jgi:hypothetical protein